MTFSFAVPESRRQYVAALSYLCVRSACAPRLDQIGYAMIWPAVSGKQDE